MVLEKLIWKKGKEMLLKKCRRHLFDNGGESLQPETGEGISVYLCSRWQYRGLKGDWPLSCRARNHLEKIALVTVPRAPSLRIWVNVKSNRDTSRGCQQSAHSVEIIGGDECVFTGLALRLSKCGAWQLEGGCHSIEVVKAISCGHAVQVPVSEASLIEG